MNTEENNENDWNACYVFKRGATMDDLCLCKHFNAAEIKFVT